MRRPTVQARSGDGGPARGAVPLPHPPPAAAAAAVMDEGWWRNDAPGGSSSESDPESPFGDDEEDANNGGGTGSGSDVRYQLAAVSAHQELAHLTQQSQQPPVHHPSTQWRGPEADEQPPMDVDDENGTPPGYDEEPDEDSNGDDEGPEENEDENALREQEDWMLRQERNALSTTDAQAGRVYDGPACAAATSSAQVAAAASSPVPPLPSPAWFVGDSAFPSDSIARYVPSFLAAAYAQEMRITQLYPWQAECLQQDGGRSLLRHGNLVYSAPTSGGKTLVAELLLFRYMLRHNLFRSRCHEFHAPSASSSSSEPSFFRCLFIVPFNALVQEKARDLQAIVRAMYHHLQASTSSGYRQPEPPPSVALPVTEFVPPDADAPKIHVKAIEHVTDLSADSHILLGVVTIEKAAMIVNQLITEKRTAEIGCVVIDECHMLSDPSRGFLLEHVLTKLRFADHMRRLGAAEEATRQSSALQPFSSSLPPLQIIALSATLPNIQDLSSCLDASFFETSFRPVELVEKYTTQTALPHDPTKLALEFHDVAANLKSKRYQPTIFPLLRTPGTPFHDPTLIGFLCYDTVTSQRNAIVFCSSKSQCVQHAKKIAAVLHRLLPELPSSHPARSHELVSKRLQLLEQLQQATLSIDPALKSTVPLGVAFHHAGLSFPERDLVELGYRTGALSVLCATTTLACGVNLGASRVVFTSLRTGCEVMDVATYKQCSGRAGRKGKDESGESIILGSADFYGRFDWKKHEQTCLRIIQQQLPPLHSCLDQSETPATPPVFNAPPQLYYPYLSRLVLDAVCSDLVSCQSELDFLLSRTLLVRQKSAEHVDAIARSCLEWLLRHDFIRREPNARGRTSSVDPRGPQPTQLFRPSPLGVATTVSALAPSDALIVHAHLSTARDHLFLEGGLHVLFLITPLRANFSLEFDKYSTMLSSLCLSHASVALHLGIAAGQVDSWSARPPSSATQFSPSFQVYRRFYTTLMLLEYMQWENSRWDQAPPKRAFLIDLNQRGTYQQLYESTKAYGCMISNFCLQLQWLELGFILKEYAGEQLSQCETALLASTQQPFSSNHGASHRHGASESTGPGLAASLRPLMELTNVRPSILAAMYRAGFTSVKKISEANMDHVCAVLRSCRVSSLVHGDQEEDSAEFQAERLKRKAERVITQQATSDAQQRSQMLRMRQQRTENLAPHASKAHSRIDHPNVQSQKRQKTDQASSVHTPNLPPTTARQNAHSAIPLASVPPPTTPRPPPLAPSRPAPDGFSQYPASMLMDQLRSPNTPSRTGHTSSSPSSAAPHPKAAASNVGGATSAEPLVHNLSTLSHSEWLEFKSSWLTRRHMFWQFFGIRRTHKEEQQREKLQQAVEALADDADLAVDDGYGIELTPAEQSDLLLSPHCRTCFLPSHGPQYPLCLQSVEGIALQLDDDPAIYQLRVGDQFNSFNELGADGPEMWEAFLTALLTPSLTCVSINMKSNFEILASLPMPRPLIQRIYDQANQRLRERSSRPTNSSLATAVPLVPPDSASSSSTSFLTLVHLASTASRPLHLVDVRVAHWMLMPTDENLLRLDHYTAWYVLKRGVAAHALANRANINISGVAASSNAVPLVPNSGAIPCSPDASSSKTGYVQQEHLRHQHPSIMRRNQYAPPAPSLTPAQEMRWTQITNDRFRYPTRFSSACEFVAQLPALYTAMLRQLANGNLVRPFKEIELPLVPVLAHIEYFGIGFLKAELLWHLERMKERYQYLEHEARLHVTCELDLQSPKKFVPVMEQALQAARIALPAWFLEARRQHAQRRQGKGQLKDVPRLLAELAPRHPLPAIIQEYRQLAFMLSHLMPLPGKALLHPQLRQERIHATLLNVTETGRLSCQEPNIQCVPKQSHYTSAPRYSVHEELALNRLSCTPAVAASSSSSRPSAPAQVHVHLSEDEKRVEREKRTARQSELQQLQKQRRSPLADRRIKVLRDEAVDRRLHCMVVQPTGEATYGLLRDIRCECIDQVAAQCAVDVSAVASSPTPAAALHTLPLADWWQVKSEGRLQWSPAARRTVRQVLVQLSTGVTLPYPADLVWRHEAFVPWERAHVKTESLQAGTTAAAAGTDAVASSCTTTFPLPSSIAAALPFSARNCFASAPGYTLLSADYSNIELRLMAHFSRDQTLIDMFRQNVDVLTSMASRLNGNVPLESVTPQQRAIAKSCVYAVLYGAGTEKIAQESGLSSDDAEHFFRSFKSLFRGVVSFTESQIAEVAKLGYITTLFQRKRWLNVHAARPSDRASERRKVANTLCQGSAADLIKAAMQRIMTAIARFEPQRKYRETARMVMQMHDELVFECRDEHLAAIKDAEFQLRVPLVVRVKTGRRWGDMQPWEDAPAKHIS